MVADAICGVDPRSLRLRVMHVWQPIGGGVPRYVGYAVAHQVTFGWDVLAVGPVDPKVAGVQHAAWDSPRAPGARVREGIADIRALVSRWDPHVVVAHSAKAGLIVRAALRGRRPTVYVPHAWSFLAASGAQAVAALAWEVGAARWTHATVAVGTGEASTGVRAGVRSPMFVVNNPVPPQWTVAEPQERAQVRRRLGLPEGPIVVNVARFSRQKGQDVLLDAWQQVAARRPEATLVMVGPGATPAMRARAGHGVRFVGATEDPRGYYVAGDVAVLASRWEGMSLAMLEAMAVGRSVVTTAVSGSEVVTAAGAGAVVPVEDSGRLAEALIARMDGAIDAVAEGRRGAAHVHRHHGMDQAMDRFAAVIARAHAFGPGIPPEEHT